MGKFLTWRHSVRKFFFIFIACVMLTLSSIPLSADQLRGSNEPKSGEVLQGTRTPSKELTTQNIIITPPEFYFAARSLAAFHISEGIPSIIVNTTWIDTMYTEAPAPSFQGYYNRVIPRLMIHRYNYDLARKIISFLRDTTHHNQGAYVTLFGNGKYIPPSYYIYSQGRVVSMILGVIPLLNFYNNIIASDFFYTSPDYDLLPDYKIGRLPVATEDEAMAVVQKIIAWRKNVEWGWFQNVYVAGDQPNLLDEMSLEGCYAGEMIACDAINRDYFDYMTVKKLFLTEGSFTRQAILDALGEGNAGFFYIMAHGYVDRWGTYKEQNPFIYADDLFALPAKTNSPIVVSVACMAGAYDTNLAIPYNLKRGTRSLGESVVLSKGAGIAYIGTTRATLGSPLLYLDNGEVVITKERGIAGMLTYLFGAYRNGTDTLGDLTIEAMKAYVAENEFPARPEKDNTFVVLMSFVLLGDPALEIPYCINTKPEPFKKPHITPIDPEGYTSEEYSRPWYYTNTTITLQVETDSPQITVKRINISSDTVVERIVLSSPVDNTFYYTFISEAPTKYLIRAESNDGKEGWFYLTTIKK